MACKRVLEVLSYKRHRYHWKYYYTNLCAPKTYPIACVSICECPPPPLNLPIGCFRKAQRKHGIRGNPSTATVPVLKWPPDQFAVSQLLDGNVRVYARLGRAHGWLRALIGWLHRSVLSLHRMLIWQLRSVFQRYGGDFRGWDDPLLRLADYPSSVVLAKTAYCIK